ncbi:MAG: hypothetical protein B7X04_04340 [Parcubacteria group bacterium 21-54-25]|nr:MAG: hypothetical protein B7X04_04340 [Parcubacteria group bacterium 21-54-25]HQU08208.1 hypothetical protein [Candidatus Paceibacterota bacterium]
MAKTVFFSWQADTPNRANRAFLKEILEDVCMEIASDTTLDEAMRDVEVDSDTQGVAGQPPIAETILKKIDEAAVFVADMTFTGTRMDDRPTPNPNVLIEYGWALKALGNGRVVCVMNIAYGEPSAHTLPFDLAHLRWPIRYNLPEGASAEVKAQEKRKSAKALSDAVRASLATVPVVAVEATPTFPLAHAKDGPARFRDPGEAIGFEDDNFNDENKEVFLSSGSAMWLRLMPTSNPDRQWPTRELKKIGMQRSLLLPLLHPAGGYSYVRASDGEGMYRALSLNPEQSRPNTVQVDAVTFAFRTGEIWSIETALLAYVTDRLPSTDIEQAFAQGLEHYAQFLHTLSIEQPYRWKAGIIGAKGRRLEYPPQPGYHRIGPGSLCATDRIEDEGLLETGQNATAALLPFFKKIFEECGIERPSYLPQ